MILASASLAITWGGILTIICELILGTLSDHVERKNVIAAVVALSGIFGLAYFFYLTNTPSPSLMVCWIFVAIISATTSVITVIMTTAGEYYTDDIRATGTGFIGTVNVVGRYLGPWLAGMLIDATGVVGNSFGIVGVTMLVAGGHRIHLPAPSQEGGVRKSLGAQAPALPAVAIGLENESVSTPRHESRQLH